MLGGNGAVNAKCPLPAPLPESGSRREGPGKGEDEQHAAAADRDRRLVRAEEQDRDGCAQALVEGDLCLPAGRWIAAS